MNEYFYIKQNCKALLKVIQHIENADKGDLNDLCMDYDQIKQDLIKSLEVI